MHYRRGFTLIETLVYMAIVVVTILTIVFVIVQAAQLYNKNRADRLVSLSAETAIDRITREIRQACDIVSVSSSTLVLKTFLNLESGASCSTATLVNRTIQVSGGQLTVDGSPLNTSSVNISSAQFTEITGDGAPEKAVRATLQLSDSANRVVRKYYTTATLRGSY